MTTKEIVDAAVEICMAEGMGNRTALVIDRDDPTIEHRVVWGVTQTIDGYTVDLGNRAIIGTAKRQ